MATTFIMTHQKHWELGWEVLLYRPYNPDQAFTIFFLHCKAFLVIGSWHQEETVKSIT